MTQTNPQPLARRALIEHRPWLFASVIAACTYWFVWNNPIGGVWLIGLKGTAVALLGIYALRRGEGPDSVLLAAVLLLSAVGTMVAELYFRIGWSAFAASHLTATALYLRNRLVGVSRNRLALAFALFLGTPLATWMLTGAASATIYAGLLGLMAATAWSSRFARRHVGGGVIALVLSDLLAFTEGSAFDAGELPELMVWPSYYAGLLMIATGVVQTLRRRDVSRR